jgi:5-methylcytosine-specific restriction endonuclease McrA
MSRRHHRTHQILVLDKAGQPLDWISHREAILEYAAGKVAWDLGDEGHVTFRGGENRVTGTQSQLTTAPIIALRGEPKKRAYKAPVLTNAALFARDRWDCAYCGRHFQAADLTRDHVVPKSRGGPDEWGNVVTACRDCNHDKDDQLLSECGMELLYLPYTPTRADVLFTKARGILPCQAEYLLPFCSDRTRLHMELAAARRASREGGAR